MKIKMEKSYDEGYRKGKLVQDCFMGFEIKLIPENKEEKEYFKSKSYHLEPFYNNEGGFTILFSEDESNKEF